MKRFMVTVVVAALSAMAGCRSSTDADDRCTAAVQLRVVEENSATVFDWTPACSVAEVLVYREGTVAWHVTSFDKGLRPPVTYAVTPNHAELRQAPAALVEGAQHTVFLNQSGSGTLMWNVASGTFVP